MKKIISGFVFGVVFSLVMSFTNVFADSFEKVVTIYTGIKIYVNDIKLNDTNNQGKPNAFIYDGVTYVAVNEVTKALKQDTVWDGNTRSLYIGKHEGTGYYLMEVCPPYQFPDRQYYRVPTTFKMAGTDYTRGFTMQDGSFALVNLNGKYNSLSFILGHIDKSTMRDGIFNIYLDGRLINQINIKCTDMPKKYDIPLNGALQLKIEKVDTTKTYQVGEWYGFADIQVK